MQEAKLQPCGPIKGSVAFSQWGWLVLVCNLYESHKFPPKPVVLEPSNTAEPLVEF